MRNSRTEENTLNRVGFPQDQGSGDSELEQGKGTERSAPHNARLTFTKHRAQKEKKSWKRCCGGIRDGTGKQR